MEISKNRLNCGCKGIRTCLLCENGTRITSDSLTKHESVEPCQTLYYCPICKEILEYPNHLQPFENLPRLALTKTLHGYCKDTSGSISIDGITVIDDFVSVDEEEYLLNEIEKQSWAVSQSGRYKQDFGPKVNFKKKKVKVSAFRGFPLCVKIIVEKLKTVAQLLDFKPVELCNLEYIPERGSSIDPHLDDSWLWGERLVTINLESDTYLTLTQKNSDNRILVPMPRRSLLILQGESRYTWLHSVSRHDITSRRVAMTFRELSREFLPGGFLFEEIGKCLLLKSDEYF